MVMGVKNSSLPFINCEATMKPVGSYLCLRPKAGSLRIIGEIIKLSEVEGCIPLDEIHMTLVYSKDDNKSGNIAVDKESSYKLKYTGVQVLGSAIALMFDPSPELIDRFKSLQDEEDIEHAFDEILPHISLKYDFGEDDLKKFEDAIKLREELFGAPLGEFEVFDENSTPNKSH